MKPPPPPLSRDPKPALPLALSHAQVKKLMHNLCQYHVPLQHYMALMDILESTIGAAFFSQSLAVNDETVKFEIWDTDGHKIYHSLAPMYYRGAAAAIIVYDVTNPAHIRVAYVAARKLAAVKAWQKSETLRRSNGKQEVT